MTSKTRILTIGLAALALAAPALAAEPESGTLSNASPKVSWTGSAPGYGIVELNSLGSLAGQAPVCEAPFCDVFNLILADSGDLNVIANDTDESGFNEVDVVMPDGTIVYTWGGEGEATRVKIKNAPKGDYEIWVQTNQPVIDEATYTATATLGSGTAAVTTPPNGGDTTPQDPQVNPPTQPQGQRPAATLSVRTTRGSIRKARKGLKLRVQASSPVTDLKAHLRKGKKVVGKGSLARLDTIGTVKLKLAKRLKPGRYVLALSARDGERTVGLQANFTLKR